MRVKRPLSARTGMAPSMLYASVRKSMSSLGCSSEGKMSSRSNRMALKISLGIRFVW